MAYAVETEPSFHSSMYRQCSAGKPVAEPVEGINIRFTGGIDAVGAAHNLLSAILENQRRLHG